MAERILIVDDDRSITSVLRRGLGYEGYDVDIAGSGGEGLTIARERPPDLVILDVMLPGLSGLEVCHRLRTVDDKLPILMLSAKDAIADQVRGLDAGADDYIVKPFVFEVLVARIRTLLRRCERESREILHYHDLSLDLAARVAKRGDREITVTTTEFELLQFFMRNPQRVLTRDFIMERVWGYNFQGDYNVLEVYVRYLRNKLEAEGEPRLIQTVRGAGYILRQRD